MSPKRDTSASVPVGDDGLVALGIPLGTLVGVGDLQPQEEQQLRDPGGLFRIDAVGLVVPSVVVGVRPVEEEQDRDAFAGEVEVV